MSLRERLESDELDGIAEAICELRWEEMEAAIDLLRDCHEGGDYLDERLLLKWAKARLKKEAPDGPAE